MKWLKWIGIAMRAAVKDTVVFSSIWRGSDGVEITQVEVTESDCT